MAYNCVVVYFTSACVLCFQRCIVMRLFYLSYKQVKHDFSLLRAYAISNSYSKGCPPVRGDNPRALASGLSYVQVDKHGITILYHLHQCMPCTSRDISC